MSKENMKEIQPEGNYYDKYASKNPIERFLVNHFYNVVRIVLDILPKSEIDTVIELGCAEGHFTDFVSKCFPGAVINATDLSENKINEAVCNNKNPKIKYSVEDATNVKMGDCSARLCCASEVLEHMDDPRAMLREMKRLSSHYILITVPNEPIWRIMNMARFKYLKRLGNTPGHVQHFSSRSLIKLCCGEFGLKLVTIKKSLPWLIILLQK